MKIAIYAGSFNPIHNGHLSVAEAALSEGFEEVWLVVSPQNPHKKEQELWPFERRLKLVELAIQSLPKLKSSDCETRLSRPSYTINTLQYLKNCYPQHQFHLLIGGDNLLKFRLWKNYIQIMNEFGLVVYPRSTGLNAINDPHPNIRFIQAPLLEISSSEIRNRLSENISIHGLVPDEVEKYLLQNLKNDRSKSVF